MKTIIEIKAAEGGDDAKLLIQDMLSIYKKACNAHSFSVTGIQWLDGCIILSVSGKNSYEFFLSESGAHRWIRIPPTEKRGRTQTSIVTVSVFKDEIPKAFEINKSDVERWFTRGTGNGGQNRNKVETVVCLKHIPTGIIVKCQEQRTQKQNEERAWEILKYKLENVYLQSNQTQKAFDKKEQVGSGCRSDKRRTYRVKEDLVVDHLTNKSSTLKNIYKGKIELLH